MKTRLRIGNGAGFWGDNLDAPARLAEGGRLDYLTLEYLAELTLSILAHQRKRDPRAGYVSDFPKVFRSLLPHLRAQPRLRIVTNAGGLNPEACARETARLLVEAGSPEVTVAWVEGDDLQPVFPALRAAGESFRHFDSGLEWGSEGRNPVSVNAYLGAGPICEALETGARVVITGRVADASLTVGPALHEFGWARDDWTALAGASVAGHLIECGAQVTGGLLTRWESVPDPAGIGYPIAELSPDGSCLITKPEGSGGVVNRDTVTEQLLYEIGDPRHYLTPDVDVDFTHVTVEEAGKDAVRVAGARGNPPPVSLKVSCAYENGYTARGDLVVCGRDAAAKAGLCGELILERLRRAGFVPEKHCVELLGTGACLPGASPHGLSPSDEAREVVLRVSVWDMRREAVERFCREISPIITSGPPGVTGYAGSRPRARPVLAYWPTRVDRKAVRPVVRSGRAGELAA